jgi:hypothetical protein
MKCDKRVSKEQGICSSTAERFKVDDRAMAPMANKSRSAHFSQILCCPRSRILKYVRSDSVQFLPASNNSVVIPGLPFEILVPGVMDEFCRFCLEMPQNFAQGPFGILHQGPILFCGRSRETQTYGNVRSILKSRVMRLLEAVPKVILKEDVFQSTEESDS